jgi:putative two-component system response regulator
MRTDLSDARILIVDDQETHLKLLSSILQLAGYNQIHVTSDPREVPAIYAVVRPDLVLLDLMMYPIDGFAVIASLRELIAAEEFVPIAMLTADVNPAHRQRALSLGARDFLTKPYDHDEVLLRIHNLLETRWMYLQLEERARRLEDALQR